MNDKSLVEQLAEINKEITVVQKRTDDLYSDRFNLEQRKIDLLPRIMIEKNLLNEIPWVVKKYNSQVYLYGNDAKKRPKLSEFFVSAGVGDWNDVVRLGDGYDLRVHDNEFTISPILGDIGDRGDFTTFIKKWNLDVDTREIEGMVIELERQMSDLVKILTTFKKN